MTVSTLGLPFLRTPRARRLAVLAVLSAAAIVLAVVRYSPGPAPASASVRPHPIGGDGLRDVTSQLPAAVVITWPLEMQRDPFVWRELAPPEDRASLPDVTALEREAKTTLDLQAIVFNGDSSRVIVNGQVLQRGATVNGFRIERIEERCIVLEKSGVEVMVDLGSKN